MPGYRGVRWTGLQRASWAGLQGEAGQGYRGAAGQGYRGQLGRTTGAGGQGYRGPAVQGYINFHVNFHASHAFRGFPWFFIPCFPCFHGELAYNFCCPMLAWKAWEFPHENHGILLRLHAPWFSRESMEFSPCFFHGFSMVFPCFQYQGGVQASKETARKLKFNKLLSVFVGS